MLQLEVEVAVDVRGLDSHSFCVIWCVVEALTSTVTVTVQCALVECGQF